MFLRYSIHIALLVCLLFAGMSVQAQLSGRYCTSYGFGTECITFGDNGHFAYTSASCTEDINGEGIYSIAGNLLILTFTGEQLKVPTSLTIDSVETSADSLKWDFVIVDQKGEPMPGAHISTGYNNTTVSDIDGKALLLLPKATGEVTVSVKGYTSDQCIIPLVSSDKNYTLLVVMEDGFKREIKLGTTMRFAIRNIKKSSIELKAAYQESRFVVYKRVHSRE